MDTTTIGTIQLLATIDTSQYTAGANTIDSANKKIESSASQTESKSNSSFNGIAKVGLAAVAAAAITAGVAITKNLGSAVDRIDSLVSFPRVLQSMGQPLDVAKAATQELSESLQGLPTSLDEGTRGVQGFVAAGLGAGQATDLFLAMNNALLAGGANAQDTQVAFDGMQRAISSGEVPTSTLTAMLSRMPTVMAALQGATGKSRDELQKLYSSNPQALIDHIIQLNEKGGGGLASLRDQAIAATGGIRSSFGNMGNAINRGMEAIVAAIGGGDLERGQQRISSSINNIGRAFENSLKVIASGILFIQTNASFILPIISGLGAMAGTFITLSTAIYVAVKAFAVLRVAMTFVAAHPVVATLSVIVGLIAAIATAAGLKNFTKDLDKSSKSSNGIGTGLGNAAKNMGEASKEAQKLAKELAKIDREVAKTNESFREQLAELVFNKRESINQLRQQLAEEKSEYNKSYNDRLYSFNQSQQQEAATHQQKVARLTSQIDFLKRYQNSSNQQQLANLQFSLARENSLYTQQVNERQTKYDQDAENERLSYEKRQAELQGRLNTETALLDKHRVDVESIRNVIMLDEIDKLKRSRDEQLSSLNQQRNDAISNANSTAAGVVAAFNSPNIQSGFGAAGEEAGKAFAGGMIQVLKDLYWSIGESIGGWLYDNFKKLGSQLKNWSPTETAKDFWKFSPLKFSLPGYASGGFTGRGGINEMAGVVHRGEYVLPQAMVDQTTGMPDLDKLINNDNRPNPNANNGSPVVVSLNNSRGAARQIAIEVLQAINEGMRAKGLPEIGTVT